MEMNEKPMLSQASEMMLEAMRKVRDKTMDPKEATAIAQLGLGVINAANAETAFIKTVRGIPRGGVFGDRIQYLEPNVSKEQEKAALEREKKEKARLQAISSGPCPYDDGGEKI
ncbi:MAG: hypothetical protein WCS18_05105 [Sphaerochaetaceae bacterium]